ncbi:putative disease resistance RPP13-like protein 1 [Arachis ipaensis]|uniref:putative disease resistance RPP13-like protein 1 n=1 Tax=Arachis ipaensis TaxID=130454 RepID=UPI0007AFCE7E|nr:putative disease resistance RPP13-like protein 1 [Arachis ipaensis]XP_020972146.1 putative disease resistance RPP13-like protein 1 [Arachis ipaensis]XP_029146729.1 putative disease resistance RPP13-like protein 1 [Arachis hypogaea]QHO25570.1 Putative disease resistance RPP13-like protein [Arachis hypogaea]QHO25571.1 Putative disease resistance RPP13-like protein [Arachis hypogaea]QHO25572.1 Putative disease resistance RPP13-like protein [Arachis hypogaea]
MAAELVGGAFLSSFLNVLFDRLSDPDFINMMRGKKVDQKLLQRLKTILNVVEAVLNDAEKKQITDPAVKRWLEDLQDAVYDADDLLDEVATKAATQKDPPGNFLSRFLNSQDREMVSRIEEIIARLEDIAKHKDILRLEKIAAKNMSGRIPSTSLVKKSDIFVGRDKERDAIVNLLLDDAYNGELSVIPIVGMGGIGKTTLAKLVYNDDTVQQKFHVKAWVCVGEEEFDVLKVTKAVIEKTCSACYSNDLDTAQNHLKNGLTGKNFLVILDDVWSSNRERWESFLTPFECGSEGGKILVTTRLDTVASVVKTKHNEAHNLSLLNEEQCWSVFANRAWDPSESRDCSTLEEIGRKIVKKCKGLPLAAQALGGLLRGKDNEKDWIDVLNSEFWELSEEDSGILPALRISYYHLPSYLKRCFVYCCLYPKDYEFYRDELTLLWMAEGLLLQPKGGNILKNVGYEYFDDLVSRSFFQRSNSDDNTFVMHDLMHDLTTFYGGKFFSSMLEHKTAAKHDMKTRHLSCARRKNDDDSLMKIMEACNRLKHVRTLMQINLHKGGVIPEGDGVTVPCDLLEQLKCLRVLSFNFSSDDENLMHSSIGKLIHLRFLDLSFTSIVTLPESLSCLYNLQTLKLRECNKLKKLPSKMQNLVNLRHLDISGTDDLEEMPKKMSELKDLQFLSSYVAGKHEENGIGELGELAHLHGSLSIEKLENVKNSGEASSARMYEKIHLNALDLSWTSFEESEVCDSQTEKAILDKLCPHKDLKMLFIWRYRGTMFPDWVGQSSYHNMTVLMLSGCRNCWMVPSLGQLPSLERLIIEEFEKVKKIGGSFYKGDGTHQHQETPFRSLKFLMIQRMPCWEEWESYECDDDDHAPFPKLEELWIEDCPKLRRDLPTFLPSLKQLRIRGCEELGCYLPRAPILRELFILGKQKARMRDLPLSLQVLGIGGKQLVEDVFEAMTHTQPTSLRYLEISNCSSAVSLPGDALPPLLKHLRINNCKNVEFPMQHQQHHSLMELKIDNSCDSLTSFALPAFPNLWSLTIERCENLTSLEVSQSQSLRGLWIEECPKLENIIRLPASLWELRIRECPLLGEGIERKDPHIWPSISHIPRIQLDGKWIRNDSTS